MLARSFTRAPGLPFVACACAVALCLAAGNAVPGGFGRLSIMGMAADLALACAFVLRAALAAAVASRTGGLREAARQPGWWTVPAACAALLAGALSPLPSRIMFLLVRPGLEAARAAAPGTAVGLWPIPGGGLVHAASLARLAETPPLESHPGWTAGGTSVLLPRTGFLMDHGCYVHLPNLPPGEHPGFLEPLGGGWFAARHED